MKLKYNSKLKFICALVFLFVLSCCASAEDTRINKISRAFLKANPKLSQKLANDYANYVTKTADKFEIDAFVVAALIIHESTVNYKAKSRGGDYGLMQVRYKVHAKVLKQKFGIKNASGLFDARKNILFGCEILANCYKRAKGNTQKAIIYYSAGNRKLSNKVLKTVSKIK